MRAAVLYHYPCPDGAFAALAAELYFTTTSTAVHFYPNTVYSPLQPHHLPLHLFSHLYLLDFVGPTGFVSQISPLVPWIVILDHHKTAMETLGGENSVSENVSRVIDMGRSGATIAFDYFKDKLLESPDYRNHQIIGEFERLRPLYEHVEDVDLWKWRLEKSKAFSSGLKDLNLEFDVQKNPSLFQQLRSLDLESVVRQGMASLSEKQKLIDETLARSYKFALGGGEFGYCLAVNADAVSQLRSELGHQLAIKSGNLNLRSIGAVVYEVPELGNNEMLKVSLRSDGEDTTVISEAFGGGGHRSASSFMISSEEFNKWKAGDSVIS